MNWLYRIFCCFFLLAFDIHVQAQDNNYLYKDSALMAEEAPAEETVAPVTEDEETATIAEERVQDSILYANELQLSKDSIQKLLQQEKLEPVTKLSQQLQRLKNNKKPKEEAKPAKDSWLEQLLTAELTKVILCCIAVFIVLYVTVKLFLARGVFSTSGKKAPAITVETQKEEMPTSANAFTALINAAKVNGDFRSATRWLYLQALMGLREKGVIEFASDKTNRQYLTEMAKAPYHPAFKQLTRQYEYIWYGNFSIAAQQFSQLEQDFVAFNKTVSQK
jgi:hypothetical protein